MGSKPKLTKEQVQQKLNERFPNTYILESEYYGKEEKIIVRHIPCNSTFETSTHYLYSGNHICPNCKIDRRNKKYGFDINSINEKLKTFKNGEYEVIEEVHEGYKQRRLKFRHKKCGTEFITAHNTFFNNGTECPTCSLKRRIKNQKEKSLSNEVYEDFLKKVQEIFNGNVLVIERYKGSKEKIKFKCNRCSLEFSTTPNRLFENAKKIKDSFGCPACNKKRGDERHRKPKEEFKKFVEESGEFILLSEYINDRTKVKIKRIDCDHEFEILASAFIQNKRCPKCYFSKGEGKIRDILNKNNINFEEQKYIEIENHKLKCDFFLEEKNIMIEYDGEFHYKDNPFKRDSKKQFKLDRLKNKYALQNKIFLFRIPFWEFNNLEKIIPLILENDEEIKNKFLVETIYDVQRLSKAYFKRNMPVEYTQASGNMSDK